PSAMKRILVQKIRLP
ncbi:calx-beta domain protein, partial [Vibrio parahaemolyticus EKP-026]